jgi:threonylcarbamoyladenosine tRNA methylthiotransferase MtaB
MDRMTEVVNQKYSRSSRYDIMIHTFGCKVNTYDTGLLQRRLNAHEAPQGEKLPRVHILNTCAVTAEASKDAVKLVRRLKAREPFSTVVITGCGAQVDGEVFDTLLGADLVVANSHKGSLEQILDLHFKGELKDKIFRSNIFRKNDLEEGGGLEEAHTRTFLKIQDGCNSFCTYCVIPFARGKSRSLSVDQLVARIIELSQTGGGREVVLTGVHIGDYEDVRDGRKLDLADLVEEILERTTVTRLRLSSLEPVELTPKLLSLYSDPRLCPHFHMSIQSANSRVLSAMKRNYDARAVEVALEAIDATVPGAFVGMDVIAGFPGETESEFLDTYMRLERLPWTRLHVFPYSERPGTKAANYDGRLSRDVKALRAQRLRDLSSGRFTSVSTLQIGKIKQALLLRNKLASIQALSRDYWPIRLMSENGEPLPDKEVESLQGLAGSEIQVRVIGLDTHVKSRMDGMLTGYALPRGFR